MKRQSTKHVVQIPAPWFELIKLGKKTYDNRPEDKNIIEGDLLHIYELAPTVDGHIGHVTGNNCIRRVIAKEVGTEALTPGFCTLGIGPL